MTLIKLLRFIACKNHINNGLYLTSLGFLSFKYIRLQETESALRFRATGFIWLVQSTFYFLELWQLPSWTRIVFLNLLPFIRTSQLIYHSWPITFYGYELDIRHTDLIFILKEKWFKILLLRLRNLLWFSLRIT